MISIRRLVLATVCVLAAAAATAAPAGAFYYPSGPQVNVDKGQLDSSARLIRWFEKAGWARDVRWPKAERLAARRAT